MPHFSSSASAAGTTSELIRLWRSRLKASPAKHHDNNPPPPPPPPVEGVLSQQSKMSEAQDSSALERRQSSDTGTITRQKSEIDEGKDKSEQRDAPSTPKSESQELPAAAAAATLLASAQQQQQQQQQQPQQQQRASAGECNLLPVLVERLRSALELSCSASPSCSSEDNNSSSNQLPSLEDSGVDSEEDLRLWSTLNDQQQQQQQQRQQVTLHNKPKLDLKFLEDILLADIHTALARLQDTLKRVDVNTLTRYNASLDSSNKLYLLRLISNLLAKLKVPDEAVSSASPSSKSSESESSGNCCRRRSKNDHRHTISVSADEVARARRLWLPDDSSRGNESSPKIAILEKSRRRDSGEVIGAPPTEQTDNSTFNDKCMKDAINQQHQSLQSKKDIGAGSVDRRRFGSLCKDDIELSENKERRSSVFCPRHHNKFTAKKSKIKRANTIDIPNYLKLRSDSPEQIQNGCFALRRPIDVSDKISAKKVVPLFEPKTDNDRKFLALINKNTDVNAGSDSSNNSNGNPGGPFKSFSYRHPATVTDKNWQNRFSSIKTNFDKQSQDSDGEGQQQAKRKTGIVDVRKRFEKPAASAREDSGDDRAMVARLPYGGPAKQKQSSFTHAPTSPFQKIDKAAAAAAAAAAPARMGDSVQQQPPASLKSGYAPKASALQAKLKMFDQEAKNMPTEPAKKIGIAPAAFQQQQQQQRQLPMENGHLNYYSFCKQFAPFASGKREAGKSSVVDATKNKLLTNHHEETDKPIVTATKKDRSKDQGKGFFAKQNTEMDNRYDFSKQYSYRKPCDAYAAENYRQLDRKPQFINNNNNNNNNISCGLFQQSISSDCVKPTAEKRIEATTQNVAVQTTNESMSERRPSEAELVNSIADYPRKQRNSVSVQTTTSPNTVYKSPNIISPLAHVAETATSPSMMPHPQATYKPQVSSNSTTYRQEQPSNYYNPSYLSDQNYYTTDNSSVYPSYQQQQQQQQYRLPTISDSRPMITETSSSSAHLPISQKLYNEFSKLPDPQAHVAPDRYDKSDFVPAISPYEDNSDESLQAFKPIVVSVYEDKALSDVAEEHIENQELSSDGIVTRYTSAIATVSSMPESPEPIAAPAQSYEPVVPRIKEAQPRHFAETTTIPVPIERKSTAVDEIQRHNMLQQSLIRRMQNEQQQQQPIRRFSQEIAARKESSPTNVGRVCALKALNESHKAQQKIHMFEEKRLNGRHQLFRPVNQSSKLNPPAPPVITQNERSPIRSPIDSSDEYLMSCANKPTRNIVLSKSESWHQLALANKGGLQLPQATQQKPPKPKSPSSLRLSKQFEASAAADNVRKMEEKVQQYFQSSRASHDESNKQTKSKSRRNLQSRKNSNSLMRSHTMPHLYDDRLFDDTVDVDQAFDSIFKEATRTDSNRQH